MRAALPIRPSLRDDCRLAPHPRKMMRHPGEETGMRRAFIAMLMLVVGVTASAEAKETIGWVERVRIYPGALDIRAKIDTGADNSSLHCECIEPYEKPDGSQWVRFTVTNYQGEHIRLEEKVIRNTRIKRHGSDVQTRPVIKLGICVGQTYRETEVNLVDRGGFEYQMLIGRSFLRKDFLIDPASRYINPPRCTNP